MSYIDDLLAKDEQVVLVAHRHILFLILNTILYVLGAIALWVLAVIAYRTLNTGKTIVTLILLVISLVPLGIAAYRFMSWKLEQYAITTYRILQVEGLINKRTFDSSLEKVNDVQMEQGMFGRIFGFGDVSIITGSDIGVNQLYGIADPFAFKRKLQETKMNLEDHGRSRRFAGQSAPAQQFVSEAQPTPPPSGTEAARLMSALVDLRDSGVISAAEYEERRNQLLQQQ